jgi:hypothetical protein
MACRQLAEKDVVADRGNGTMVPCLRQEEKTFPALIQEIYSVAGDCSVVFQILK